MYENLDWVNDVFTNYLLWMVINTENYEFLIKKWNVSYRKEEHFQFHSSGMRKLQSKDGLRYFFEKHMLIWL